MSGHQKSTRRTLCHWERMSSAAPARPPYLDLGGGDVTHPLSSEMSSTMRKPFCESPNPFTHSHQTRKHTKPSQDKLIKVVPQTCQTSLKYIHAKKLSVKSRFLHPPGPTLPFDTTKHSPGIALGPRAPGPGAAGTPRASRCGGSGRPRGSPGGDVGHRRT